MFSLRNVHFIVWRIDGRKANHHRLTTRGGSERERAFRPCGIETAVLHFMQLEIQKKVEIYYEIGPSGVYQWLIWFFLIPK